MVRYWSHNSGIKARAIAWAKSRKNPREMPRYVRKLQWVQPPHSNMGGAWFIAIVTDRVKCPGAM